MKNKKRFHIAAVSLIEIMMIFTIIGIVTGACVSLTGPKNEYMKKIKLYSAFMALESAGKTIAAETHIDFTTDVHTCVQERVNDICPDYTTTSYPGISNSLPKTVYRSTENNTEVDPGLTTNTAYSTLSATRQDQFKYLQSGLCQRLSRTFNLSSAGANCDATLITTRYPTSFSGYTPQLYLPNGQVIYLNQNLYFDVRNNTSLSVNEINITSYAKERQLTSTYTCEDLNDDYSDLFSNNSTDTIVTLPNETRLYGLKRYINCGDNGINPKYWQKIWEKNKDYFLIYVDTNGKMIDNNDRQRGPDTLNKDVFAFRMYRDGTVLPDYKSGFPKEYIKAKKLQKDLNDPNGNYVFYDRNTAPIVYSRCYANLAGTYSSGHQFDSTGICTDSGPTAEPENICITATGDSMCKSVIVKPSFFIR